MMEGRKFLFTAVLLLAVTIGLIGATLFSEIPKEAEEGTIKTSKVATSIVDALRFKEPTIKYGFVFDNYEVHEAKLKKNQFLADILTKHGISNGDVTVLAQKTRDIFDVRKLRQGKGYTILAPKKKGQAAKYFIYEPSPYRYVVYNLQDFKASKMVERQVDTVVRHASGVITSSLWNAIMDGGMDHAYHVAAKLEGAFAWSVDFHHIQKNDKFKLIYNELFIEGKSVGVGDIQAGYFKHGSKENYAYKYTTDEYDGFFDKEGRPMKKAFLKSPVKYARISSAYNLRRFHPVLRRVKAHLGTDYAAPTGTPIYAVASGTVLASSRTRGNGNYVKIKHDKTYTTQYLHMSKFAKGMRKGKKVMQGDVIGYVGSTGLATGPHVCFRFWKNGRQVDHRKQDLPAPDPMKGADLESFKVYRDAFTPKLDAIEFGTDNTLAKVKKKDANGKFIP